MKLHIYLFITFFVAFLLQYAILPYIVTAGKITHSRGKIYISLSAASIMGLLEVIVFDSYHSTFSIYYYIALGLLFYLSAYAFRSQLYISESDYMHQMIETANKDILLSNNIIATTHNINVQTIATNILHRRNKDRDVMNKLLSDIDNKKPMPITKSDAFAYQKLL
jgi:hypothetical protein